MSKFNKKTKIIIAAVSSILVLTCVVGVTLALLRTKSDPVTNKFKGAAVNIGVVEGGSVYENDTIPYPDIKNGSVTKEVAVKNIDSPDYPTTDTWVRVRLVPIIRYNNDAEKNAGEIAPVSVDASKLTYTMGDKKWLASSGSEKLETYYYYSEAVKPGAVTGKLITAAAYTGEIPEDAHFELQVLTEGVSAKQKGAVEAAWGSEAAKLLKLS